MYQDTDLKNHMEQSSSISVKSLILAEWNLNFADNVKLVGNYRYRPTVASPTTANYGVIAPTYDSTDTLNAYTNALVSDSTFFRANVADESTLLYYKSENEKEKILYSLTDCLGRFRPRSGINKIRYGYIPYLTYPNQYMHQFPRYYLSSKDDKFKYWTSYRKESPNVGAAAVVRGLSNTTATFGYYIDDANPFVVYNRPVPANRIVVKMQTNVSDISGTITNVTTADAGGGYTAKNPFYENPSASVTATVNQTTPIKWYIDYLDKDNNWTNAKTFDNTTTRSTGKRIIGADGYVELAYGISNIPIAYLNNFLIIASYSSTSSLPSIADIGNAYLIGGSTSSIGTFYVWSGSAWDSFVPTYGWVVAEETITANTTRLIDLVSPDYYSGSSIYTKLYRDFQFIYGIRIRVETMAKKDSTFDLIEMSPRLVADLSDKTISYSITKIASDIGNTGMPVGQLLASNGSLEIFDYDQAFNQNNTNSILNILDATDNTKILSSFITKNLQIKFFEIIKNVSKNNSLYNYYVPIKTLYADGFPQINNTDRKTTIPLRNLYFYLESLIPPPMLYRNITVSMAVSLLLDSVGFSNYIFNRIDGNINDQDDVIPFFYVGPDTTVAQVLNDIAVSTQTAIFFDEYNNLVFMSRNRMLPKDTTEKATDITLYGTKDFSVSGAIKNSTQSNKQLSNIINIVSQSNDVFNSGKITYVNRYIQKSILNLSQASQLNNSKNYYYKPVLLWEASGTENTMAINDEATQSSGFVLSALVLNSDLSTDKPTVDSTTKKIKNNRIDFGQGVYGLSRYKSYFYSNGEIIKYDAIEYTIPSYKITGVTGSISSGSNKITLISGTTTNSLFVGQTIDITYAQDIVLTINSQTPVFSSGKVTLTTSTSHGYNVGDSVTISGLTPTGYNGTYTITDKTDTSFSYTNATTGDITAGTVFRNLGFTKTTITAIDSSTNSFTVNATATGNAVSLVFSATTTDTTVWISSAQEYANYFSKVPFGGKIYPTGFVRIYAEPKYDSDGITYTVGDVAKHGRAQFGTTITSHSAALNSNWVVGNIKNILMESTFIFNDPYLATNVTYQRATSSGSPERTITVTESTSNIKVGWYVTGTNIPTGTKIATIESDTVFTVDKTLTSPGISAANIKISSQTDITAVTTSGKAGDNNANAGSRATISSVIRDKFSSTFLTETSLKTATSSADGSIRSSALTLKGNDLVGLKDKPLNYVSYILKTLDKDYNHYGTRARIIGQQSIDGRYQTPSGSLAITTKSGKTFSGSSGGLCFRVDQTNNLNIGYYFEIAALNENSVTLSSGETVSVNNIYFYKITKKSGSSDTDAAIPILLWSGLANINVDSGDFVSTQRLAKQTATSSYDLAIETTTVNSTEEIFSLYINDVCIAKVSDKSRITPTTANNSIGIFVRGTSKLMFENIYALGLKNSNSSTTTTTPLSTIDTSQLFANGRYSKYGISSSISNTFLRGLSSSSTPDSDLYVDEFGTIMREAAYLNVRYDKAYPAIYAKIAPTYNDFQSYAIAGFNANPYAAEFLVINVTDSAISLDEQSSNYLRIYGIAPTQQSSHDLTVDEYFSRNSDFSNPQLNDSGTLISPSDSLKKYSNIQNSRITYGKKDFTISGPYIQSESTAKKLMDWMVTKNMSKQSRRSVGVEIFANPMIQLGDIVTIDYSDSNSINQISYANARFVVYNIEYKRDFNGPSMTIYLSEVT